MGGFYMSSGQTRSMVLVGCGRMGQNHLRAIQRSNSFKLVGVVDPENTHVDPALLGNVPLVNSLKELDAKNITFSCGLIASPTGTHSEVAELFLNRDTHLFIEKPLTSTYEQGQKIGALAKKKNLVIVVGHVERFNPGLQQLKAVLSKNLIGDLVSVQTYRGGMAPQYIGAGNDVLLDMAVHDLDALHMCFGSFSVESARFSLVGPKSIPHHVDLVLKNSKKGSALVTASWLSPMRSRNLRAVGTEGVAYLDFIERKTTVYKKPLPDNPSTPQIIQGSDVLRDLGQEPIKDALDSQLQDFFLVLEKHDNPSKHKDFCQTICSGQDGADVVKLTEEARALAKEVKI